MRDVERLYVLVSGRPGSGKSTLATALAAELQLPLIPKDAIKEALMDALGAPTTVAESQRLGGAAIQAMLAVAAASPGAVMDSTWFPHSRPYIERLVGCRVEVHCACPADVARNRYRARAGDRHAGHLDHLRTDDELFTRDARAGEEACIDVDTTDEVDVVALAAEIRRRAYALGSPAGS